MKMNSDIRKLVIARMQETGESFADAWNAVTKPMRTGSAWRTKERTFTEHAGLERRHVLGASETNRSRH